MSIKSGEVQSADSSYADTYLRGGKRIYVFAADSLAIAVSLTRDPDNLRAQLHFVNLAKRRFDVDPSTIVLTNEDGSKPKPRKYRSPEDLAKSMRRRADWAAALTVIAADLDTDEVKTTSDVRLHGSTSSTASSPDINTTVTGSVTSRTTAPNQEARRRAAKESDRLVSAAAANASELMERSLQATTLFYDEEVAGAVHFEQDKKGRRFSIVVPTRRGVVRFPITLP